MVCFEFDLILICQASTIPRCYPPAPETGIEIGDNELVRNVEENVEVADDNEATKDEEEKEEEEEDDEEYNDVRAFIAKRRRETIDDLTDTTELSPSGRKNDDADHVPSTDAALEASTAQPPKRPPGVYTDEDELLFES
jgi:hypothetical protein